MFAWDGAADGRRTAAVGAAGRRQTSGDRVGGNGAAGRRPTVLGSTLPTYRSHFPSSCRFYGASDRSVSVRGDAEVRNVTNKRSRNDVKVETKLLFLDRIACWTVFFK